MSDHSGKCFYCNSVGAPRFELGTSCSQSRRASQAALRPEQVGETACKDSCYQHHIVSAIAGRILLVLSPCKALLLITFRILNQLAQPLKFLVIAEVNDDLATASTGLPNVDLGAQKDSHLLFE